MTDRGFGEFHPFVIKLSVPRPKQTTNAGQRESTMLAPKPQFHMNLISQEPQPGNHLFDNTAIKRRQS